MEKVTREYKSTIPMYTYLSRLKSRKVSAILFYFYFYILFFYPVFLNREWHEIPAKQNEMKSHAVRRIAGIIGDLFSMKAIVSILVIIFRLRASPAHG